MRRILLALSLMTYSCAATADDPLSEWEIDSIEFAENYIEGSPEFVHLSEWTDAGEEHWYERYVRDHCERCPDCCIATPPLEDDSKLCEDCPGESCICVKDGNGHWWIDATLGDTKETKCCTNGEESDECSVLEEASHEDKTFSQHCKSTPPEGFDRMVRIAAEEYGINPKALAVTIYRESRCSRTALGKVGEIGLTQIYPRIWMKTLKKELEISTKEDLWDPQTNLLAGAYILWRCSKRAGYRNPEETFRIYNGSGEGARRYAAASMRSYRRIWRERPWVRKRSK